MNGVGLRQVGQAFILDKEKIALLFFPKNILIL
jgi:hypothetical protein